LQETLRDFHSRTGDLLLVVAPRLDSFMDELGIFKHPSRFLTLRGSRHSAENSWQLVLDPALEAIRLFCTEARLRCSWPQEALPALERWGFSLPSLPQNPDRAPLKVLFGITPDGLPPENGPPESSLILQI